MHIRAFIWNNCANDKLSTHSEYCWCVSHYDHFMICGAWGGRGGRTRGVQHVIYNRWDVSLISCLPGV